MPAAAVRHGRPAPPPSPDRDTRLPVAHGPPSHRPAAAGTRPDHAPPVVRGRRRLAVLLVVVAMTGLLTLLGGDPGAEAGPEPAPVEHTVVEPGETLWEIALRRAPSDTDPRAYLDRLRRLNGLDASVPAWTVLRLP